MHDMQFEMQDSVETEVLDLIDRFRGQAKGRFRVNACKLHDPKESGLTAQCALRFVTIPLTSGTTSVP